MLLSCFPIVSNLGTKSKHLFDLTDEHLFATVTNTSSEFCHTLPIR